MFNLVAMMEHIGPSFIQGHYVSYILKQQKVVQDGWVFLVGYTKAGLYTDIPIYGEGYPVSWCLNNREEQILLTYNFQHLMKKTQTSGVYIWWLWWVL